MLTLPAVIGHRGACAYAPENTLASFAKAAELGCAMVEFDVRLSADGVPVVFHDDTLDRRTDGRGPVGRLALAALKRLDAGGGQAIPTLAEVLELCQARGMAVNMEIKSDRGAATAAAALAVTRGLWRGQPPLVSSFDRDALASARDLAPGWPRALLVERVPAAWPELVQPLRLRRPGRPPPRPAGGPGGAVAGGGTACAGLYGQSPGAGAPVVAAGR